MSGVAPDIPEERRVELAIALFERNFSELRIEAALRQCSTLETALAWLEADGERTAPSASSSAGVAAEPQPAPLPKVLLRQFDRAQHHRPHHLSRPSNDNEENKGQRRTKKKSADGIAAPGSEERHTAQETRAIAPSPLRGGALSDRGPCNDADGKDSALVATEPEKQHPRLSSDTSTVELPPNPAVPSAHASAAEAERLPDSCDSVSAVRNENLKPAATRPPQPAAVEADRGPHSRPVGRRDGEEALAIRPMETDTAAAWWAKASARWLQICEDEKSDSGQGAKRAADADSADAAPGTPTKRLRTGQEADTAGSPLPSTTAEKTGSPSPSTAVVGQFAARSTPSLLNSPGPTQMRSRRSSCTPGTSPRAQMKYNTSIETCSICCEDMSRGYAVRLGCRHGWYCERCMVKHAEARLEVGAAHVACPECAVPIAECNLRRLLPSEVIERLLARSLEQAVSSTTDLYACPTPNCPMRVALGEDELPRLQCSQCGKQSCLRCGAQPYHKGLNCQEYAERLRARAQKKAEREAEEVAEAARKEAKREGKSPYEAENAAKSAKKKFRQQAEAKAEDSFRQWMQETGSKQCPTCGIVITKQNLKSQSTQYQECHKMFCRNCNTKFCFKCLKVLSDTVSCKCSIAAHGFVDYDTGKRIEHLRKVPVPRTTPAKTPGRPANKRGGR